MKTTNNIIIAQNKIFLWIAAATGVILLMLFVVMQFSSGMDWNTFDFIVAGALLFDAGSLFALFARKFSSHRIVIGIAVALALAWLWAELAVGIFTTWGS